MRREFPRTGFNAEEPERKGHNNTNRSDLAIVPEEE